MTPVSIAPWADDGHRVWIRSSGEKWTGRTLGAAGFRETRRSKWVLEQNWIFLGGEGGNRNGKVQLTLAACHKLRKSTDRLRISIIPIGREIMNNRS